MALRDFNDRDRDPVPNNTIRKTWDAYYDENLSGQNIGQKYNDAHLDGREYSNTHNYKHCKVGNLGCILKGRFSSGRVPIGGWARVHDGDCNDKIIADIAWRGDGWNNSSWPEKLPEEIATDCAGGYKYDWEKTPTTNSDRRYQKNRDRRTHTCTIGILDTPNDDEENCMVGGVQWPVFCQMGDYAGTQEECRRQCKGRIAGFGSDNYCKWALDRLCGKTPDDYIKKDGYNNRVKSDRAWIKEEVCKDYCGSAKTKRSDLCENHKRKYCRSKTSWPGADEYCFDFWSENPSTSDMNNACGHKLTDELSDENVTKDKGCGFLCRGEGQDVNPQWCNSKRREYCTKSTNNMFSQYCFNFCKDNPDLCEEYLQKTVCPRITNEKMDLPVGNTGKKFSDWCGCMRSTQFYEDYKDKVLNAFRNKGYNIEGIASIRTEPECMYPKCKGGAIMSSDQQNNAKHCGSDCVQIMLNNFDDSEINGDFYAQQSAKCSRIRKEDYNDEPSSSGNGGGGSGGSSGPSSSGVIVLPEDISEMKGGTPATFNIGVPGEELSQEDKNKVIGIWISIAFGILLIIIIIWGIIEYNKDKKKYNSFNT